MRICVMATTALLACGAFAAQAEDIPTNKTDAAVSAQPAAPAAAAPDTARSAGESKADKQPTAPAGARYGFERVDGGYLRLDYQTGHLSYCMPRPEGWGCQAVPEDRAALEREVEQLRAELADLKARLKSLDDVPRPPQPVPPESKPALPGPTSGSGDMTFSVPGRDHIARAASAVQDAWQHFVEMVTALKNDVLRRTGA
jgi:hypothetical protein